MALLLYRILNTILMLYVIVLIVRTLLPLLGVSYAHPAALFVYRITEPLLAPIRRRLPVSGPFDFSPMVLILIIWLIQYVIQVLLIWIR